MNTKIDLNEAFAKHWDTKNPSTFVRSCNTSRDLYNDYTQNKMNLELFYKKTEEYNKIYSSCTIGREGQSTNGIEVDVDLSDANKIVRASNFF